MLPVRADLCFSINIYFCPFLISFDLTLMLQVARGIDFTRALEARKTAMVPYLPRSMPSVSELLTGSFSWSLKLIYLCLTLC